MLSFILTLISMAAAGAADPHPTVTRPVTPPPPLAIPPAPPPPTVTIISNPGWAVRPDADLFSRYYPEKAYRAGVGGRVVLACDITLLGAAANCVVESEDPAGYGFGEAAVRMSAYFEMKPATRDGAPVASTMRIPLRFVAPPPEPATAEPADGLPPPVPAPSPPPMLLGDALDCYGVFTLTTWQRPNDPEAKAASDYFADLSRRRLAHEDPAATPATLKIALTAAASDWAMRSPQVVAATRDRCAAYYHSQTGAFR